MAERLSVDGLNLLESARKIPADVRAAAARVIEQDGYRGASMGDIARAAGMTKPGLYYHVISKEALLFAIHDNFASWLVAESEKIVQDHVNWQDKLKAMVRLNFRAIALHKAEVTVFLREYSHLPENIRASIDELRDRYRCAFEGMIRQGASTNEIQGADERLDALFVLGACNWAYVWFDPSRSRSSDEVADYFFKRILYGLNGEIGQ